MDLYFNIAHLDLHASGADEPNPASSARPTVVPEDVPMYAPRGHPSLRCGLHRALLHLFGKFFNLGNVVDGLPEYLRDDA